MDIELKLLTFQISSPQLNGHESVPRYEEVLSLSEVKGVQHMADAGVFIKKHVLLHAVLAGVE